MKITRQSLKDLINEEIKNSRSVLLEMPYREDDSEYEEPVDLTAQALHHLSRQAETLFQIVTAGKHDTSKDQLEDKTVAAINRLAKEFEEIFKAVEMDNSRR
tara:strand:- start:68765 stop:69070 length:306 start_codon:yes stop_codon:yes gene_type:complete